MNDILLEQALQTLGQVLQDRGVSYDLVAIGGGALLLQGIVPRPTEDLDIIARAEGDSWVSANPFPKPLETAIRDVGQAMDLPLEDNAERDWINPGPAILVRLGLPEGFEKRVDVRRYGGLVIRIASRFDLIHLKLLAATSSYRRSRRRVDLDDLVALKPTSAEWSSAIRWCARLDGRSDFYRLEAKPVLDELGIGMEVEDV
ncbi:MAG: hypothetical protein PF508_15830 [Spirochaeta sp.]|jgi:hypothetical protein|nr:hypothetical protein [Spirochaeta sp.]